MAKNEVSRMGQEAGVQFLQPHTLANPRSFQSQMRFQVIQCRAAVAFAANEPLKIVTIDVEPPRAGEVRVKVVSTGVSIKKEEHSDRAISLLDRYPGCQSVCPAIPSKRI